MSELKEFTAQLKTKGVASTAHFSVLFNTPNSFNSPVDLKAMFLYCHSVNIPGLNINTTPNLSYGDNYEVPYEKMYGAVEMSFYVDNDMQVKDYFDKWIQSIADPVTRNLRYYDDYTTDINIIVQNKNNKNVYLITLYQAYPKTLGDVQLDYALSEVMKQNVTFVYRYHKTVLLSDVVSSAKGAITDAGAIISDIQTRAGVAINNLQSNSIEYISGKIPEQYFSQFNSFQQAASSFDIKKIIT